MSHQVGSALSPQRALLRITPHSLTQANALARKLHVHTEGHIRRQKHPSGLTVAGVRACADICTCVWWVNVRNELIWYDEDRLKSNAIFWEVRQRHHVLHVSVWISVWLIQAFGLLEKEDQSVILKVNVSVQHDMWIFCCLTLYFEQEVQKGVQYSFNGSVFLLVFCALTDLTRLSALVSLLWDLVMVVN